MSFNAIVDMLRARIGLDLMTVGENAGHEAIRARMSASRLPSIERYHERLLSDPREIDALVEEIVVPETWFFREPAAYALLCARAREDAPTAADPFRTLCVPCATGEEPYSVVMALLDAGIPEQAVAVQAIDVSRRALAEAERAVYGDIAFRGLSTVPARHFEREGDRYRVVSSVRERVRFNHGNVLDASLCAGATFDAVFCRNLLIYLDRSARAASFASFRRWLKPKGVLFVGHAESAIAIEHGLSRVGDPASFAFEVAAPATARRRSLPARKPSRRPPSLRASSKAKALSAQKAAALKPARLPVDQPADKPADKRDAVSPVEELRALADRGELTVARARCQALVQSHASAAGYCLLGVICQSSGDLEAARAAFDRALYLEPRHYEALVHLAMLHERAGRADLASTLRKRAERSRSAGAPR